MKIIEFKRKCVGGTVKGDTQTTNKLNTFDYLELDRINNLCGSISDKSAQDKATAAVPGLDVYRYLSLSV